MKKIFYFSLLLFSCSNVSACDFFELNSGGWKVDCANAKSKQKELRKDQWLKQQWRSDLVRDIKVNAKMLEKKFKTNLVFPISIFILPSNHFNDANAYFNQGRIFIKSGHLGSKTLLHEMVHLVLFRISKDQIPKWLDEGLAVHVSNDLKIWEEGCEVSSEECNRKKFYYDSYLKVKKIIKDIGIKKLTEAIKTKDMDYFQRY